MINETENRLSCPCCGNLTICEYGNYEVCSVCGWEDDPVQSDDPTFAGGANHNSLNEARAYWQATKGKVR